MQIEVQVGMGSAHFVRDNRVLGGKAEDSEGERVCLPQGQWVTSEGDLGHCGGVRDGG